MEKKRGKRKKKDGKVSRLSRLSVEREEETVKELQK